MELFSACKNGDVERVEALLKSGADPNLLCPKGHLRYYVSCLQVCAMRSNSLPLMSLLLNHGADPNLSKKGLHPSSALELAIMNGNISVVPLLLNSGAKVTLPVLREACDSFNLELLERLLIVLRSDGDPNKFNDRLSYCLVFCLWPENEDCVDFLLKLGADPNYVYQNGSNPLHSAVIGGSEKIVKRLLDAGARVNKKSKHSESTELHLAVRLHRRYDSEAFGCAKHLLAFGAHVDAVDDKGRTPLQIATSRGLDKVTKLLKSAQEISLKCLASRVVKKNCNLDKVYLPPILKDFVNLH